MAMVPYVTAYPKVRTGEDYFLFFFNSCIYISLGFFFLLSPMADFSFSLVQSRIPHILCRKRDKDRAHNNQPHPYTVIEITPPPKNLGIRCFPSVRILLFFFSFNNMLNDFCFYLIIEAR